MVARAARATGLIVEVEPFARLSRAEQAGVQTEAEALARFLGGELELSLS